MTGPLRVNNDVIVGFYNAIQRWNEFYMNGTQIFLKLQQSRFVFINSVLIFN